MGRYTQVLFKPYRNCYLSLHEYGHLCMPRFSSGAVATGSDGVLLRISTCRLCLATNTHLNSRAVKGMGINNVFLC